MKTINIKTIWNLTENREKDIEEYCISNDIHFLLLNRKDNLYPKFNISAEIVYFDKWSDSILNILDNSSKEETKISFIDKEGFNLRIQQQNGKIKLIKTESTFDKSSVINFLKSNKLIDVGPLFSLALTLFSFNNNEFKNSLIEENLTDSNYRLTSEEKESMAILFKKWVRNFKRFEWENRFKFEQIFDSYDFLTYIEIEPWMIFKKNNTVMKKTIDSLESAFTLSWRKVKGKSSDLPSITFITDKNQFKFSITNSSLILKQVKNTNGIIINIIFIDLERKKKRILKILSELPNSENIRPYFIDGSIIKIKNMNTKHITFAGNARIFLADIIKDKSTWYMDNDTVVIGDVRYALKMFDKKLFYGRRYLDDYVKTTRGINLDKNYKNKYGYYNSGSIHIPLEKIRNTNFLDNAIKANKMLHTNDQDILNMICEFEEMPWFLNIARDQTEKEYCWLNNKKISVFHFLSIHKQWSNTTYDNFKKASGSLTKEEFKKMLEPMSIWKEHHSKIWKN